MKLETVSIDITNKCNLRCKHCFNYSGEQSRNCKELSDQEFLKIINEVCDYKPKTICICGGETLLRKELIIKCIEMIKRRTNEYTSVNLVSNGFFLDNDIASKLKNAKIDLIQVSLDGASSDTHNWLRNNEDAFKKALKALRVLKEYNISSAVAFTPTKKNHLEVLKVLDICRDMNVKFFRSQPLMLMGRGYDLKKFSLNDIEYFRLVEILKKAKKEQKYKDLSIEWGDPISHLKYYSNIDERKLTDLNISAYGDIMLSPYFPVMIGNLRSKSLDSYVKAGIENIYCYQIIKELLTLICDWNKMQINDINPLFPILGINDNLNLDVLSNNLRLLTLNDIISDLTNEENK